jgi:hypothetical protein
MDSNVTQLMQMYSSQWHGKWSRLAISTLTYSLKTILGNKTNIYTPYNSSCTT